MVEGPEQSFETVLSPLFGTNKVTVMANMQFYMVTLRNTYAQTQYKIIVIYLQFLEFCLLYTSDAADE